MSETIDEQVESELAGDGFLRRTFAAEVSPGGGRTVDLRIVPYDEVALATDGHGGVPKGVAYREKFARGAFSHQANAANRVLANFEHELGIAGVVGHGTQLREAPDAFYGSFKLHETPDGDKALMLVREGVLDGVSLEFAPLKSVRSKDGVVVRAKAHLDSIALTRNPAYESARVLALREQVLIDETLLPVDPDRAMLERMKSLGLALPARYVIEEVEPELELDEALRRDQEEVERARLDAING